MSIIKYMYNMHIWKFSMTHNIPRISERRLAVARKGQAMKAAQWVYCCYKSCDLSLTSNLPIPY